MCKFLGQISKINGLFSKLSYDTTLCLLYPLKTDTLLKLFFKTKPYHNALPHHPTLI
jgi:hypothetical protein